MSTTTAPSQTRNTVYVAVFAAMIAAMGLVPPITLGVIPVPITLQTLGVMLAGAMLGPWRGALASLIVVVLSVAGLPLLAGGRGGLGVLLGPTGGYLVGWFFGSLVIGALFKYWVIRLQSKPLQLVAGLVSTILGGIVVIYLFGVPWTAVVTGLDLKTSLVGSFAFLPGDLLKAVVATLVALTVHRSYRGLLK
ncbi:biotin transporter BioY [Glutamicibacter protophormiae]|uniref:Biotin transporter n=1 Tax=Glutamicibacter protophormiae TaxID=37930 RepID=A0ABS4XUI8_GLUPR|nr:biotin transporter BioY [Glutamicibacter protophormiae]MBP2399912.1 biotin transport system substrate-specific component [Glutamicibacter protophormiae]QRQ77249.1 biotin transporter BioY [Glutamicibacter protophormiae]WPR63229.1 biotin transporter BioY [Glutamicibacter protophormiae]WPR66725.1 biotin transporter BioY [Glutamicibacter protophormiae]GGL76746.1 biotin transporter BioY [Glutamicibacter protophormiae]